MSTKSAKRLECIESNVWVEFIQLSHEFKPLNLGQGFPDFAAPEHITKALSSAVISDENILINQYTRDMGHPRLVKALSGIYSKLINRKIDAYNEILVTSGAYEALFCTFMAFVNPGDEVIIIEPYFDCYEPMTRMAGGVPVFVPLHPKPKVGPMSSSEWILDPIELESKFSSKTKFILINTPNNPLGKIFSRKELQMIGNLCKKYDCIAVMDEVYEWIVYDTNTHTRMASLPDMWERTITIGSGGKSFSVTGWKLGWAYGPLHLITPLYLIHQNNVSSSATPTQEALAIGFEIESQRMDKQNSYWKQLSQSLETKRNRMFHFLSSAQMNPILPEGGYFMIADISKLADNIDLSSETGTKDYKFAKWMTKNKKLQAIPVSAFYSKEHKHLSENYIRFCFIKKEETLEKCEQIIKEFNKNI